ncbi:MAG TPA: hypothetical protein VEW28_01555 [Candidatus Kapabacteria bacterium]|nr:hypothetical protein [Candidatus Kapabacteria bacterium]
MIIYKIELPVNQRDIPNQNLEQIIGLAHLYAQDMTALGQDRRSAKTYYLLYMDEAAFPFNEQIKNFLKMGWKIEECSQKPFCDLRFKGGDELLFDQYLA